MADGQINAEQIEYWNEQGGPQWVQLQERLDAQNRSVGTGRIGAGGRAAR